MLPLLLAFWLITGLVAAQSACAGSLTYSAEPIEGWVIDAVTKKPLDGVVVTANWQLEEGTFGGSVPVGQLMVLEAVTDKDGHYGFPAWGPKKAPRGHLVIEDPKLLFFKSGYEYQRLLNRYSSDRELRLRPVRRSDWNGKTILLTKFTGTPKEWFEMLDHVLPGGKREDTKRFPKLLTAILAEESSVPDSIVYKQPFFANIRRLLAGE